MDGFSVASLSSLCSSICHSALANATEITDLLRTIPSSQHAKQLASLSSALKQFSVSVSQFEASINGAPVISQPLQDQLGRSLVECQGKFSHLGKQVVRLQPDTVPRLNSMFVTVNGDLLVAYTQLLGFFQEVLAMTQREDQYAALHGPGRRIIEQSSDTARMLSKAGEILIGTGNTVPDYSADTDPAQGERNLEQPPPYSFEPSAAGPSTAGPSTAGPSNAAAGDDTWGSSLVQTFKALTSGFRAKPDPLATALCGASRNGDVAQIAAFLKQGANIDGKNENGETALECAILGNQETAARLLLSSGADEDQWSKMPPLFLAASVGNIEVARMIYERGGSAANVKKKSVSGQPYFVDLVSSGNLDGVRFLLERGADPKAQSVSGRYVVIQAARKVNVDMVRLLLDFGAKVNSDDISGNSMLAISLDKGSLEMLDLLIARGVKLSSRTTSGEKVLAAAIVKRNMPFARRLLEAGADGHVEDIHGQKVIIRVIKDTNKWSADEQAELVHMLLKNGAKPTSKDGHGSNMTALPLAIDKGVDGRIIASMIQHGGDGNKVLRSGETPLTHAINNGRMEQIHALLAGGVDPNLANKQNKTPLMQALVKDDIDLVKLLVKHGADVDAPKHSAREFAATLGRTDILEVLGVVPSGGVVSGVSDGPPGYDAVLSGKA